MQSIFMQAKVTNPDGIFSATVWNSVGEAVATLDSKGLTLSWFDGSGERTGQLDAAGVFRRWGYDPAGNQTSSTDGNGNTWLSLFDAGNRQVLAVAPATTSLSQSKTVAETTYPFPFRHRCSVISANAVPYCWW
jgi:YD repeat-containing protein